MTSTLTVAILVAVLMLVLGGALSTVGPWSRALRNPTWPPPAALFGPAPQTRAGNEGERCFIRLHKVAWIDPADAETRLKRAIGFDTDLWIVEVEDRAGRAFLDLVEG